jgi:hypothetical protein
MMILCAMVVVTLICVSCCRYVVSPRIAEMKMSHEIMIALVPRCSARAGRWGDNASIMTRIMVTMMLWLLLLYCRISYCRYVSVLRSLTF